jgi:uncharacterized membrane protein
MPEDEEEMELVDRIDEEYDNYKNLTDNISLWVETAYAKFILFLVFLQNCYEAFYESIQKNKRI